MRFESANVDAPGMSDINIVFHGEKLLSKKDISVRTLRTDRDMCLGKIRQSRDVSRDFVCSVWEYIQKHRLFR